MNPSEVLATYSCSSQSVLAHALWLWQGGPCLQSAMFHTFTGAPLQPCAASTAVSAPLLAAPGSESTMAPQTLQHAGAPAVFNSNMAAAASANCISSASAAAPAPATGCGGTAASPLSAGLADVYPEWSTGEVQLDTWLKLKMQSQEVFNKLASIPVRDRRQLVSACKHREGGIMNMTSYVLGCIRKVQSGSQAVAQRSADGMSVGTVGRYGKDGSPPTPTVDASSDAGR